MKALPNALLPFASYDQFILWGTYDGKDKVPLHPLTLRPVSLVDHTMWMSAKVACDLSGKLGLGVGFVFAKSDPFWFLDIDHCMHTSGAYSPIAEQLMTVFAGCAIEISQSGEGLHVFGQGTVPPHSMKNSDHNIEFYTTDRFAALTGNMKCNGGSAALDTGMVMPWLVDNYFPPGASTDPANWTTVPVPEWTEIPDDDVLIAKAMASGSALKVFSGKASFADLFDANADKLAVSYPDQGERAYDASSADMALATHLSFWTGKDLERLMVSLGFSKLSYGGCEASSPILRPLPGGTQVALMALEF